MRKTRFFLVFLIVCLVVPLSVFVPEVHAPDYLTMQAIGNAYRFRTKAEDYVYVGDPFASSFKPLITLYRWGSECSFSIGFDDSKIAVKSSSLSSNTLSWTTPLFDFRYYPLQQDEYGALEFEVVLKQKPPVNSWTFSVNMENLVAYYQPPLTEKEVAEGCFRPENVEGSYAFYHVSRSGNEYLTGKAFHLYRPELIDSKDGRAWADLNLTKDTLTIMLPQDFLDNAVYPVIIDPSFGYTSLGGSTLSSEDYILGTSYASGGAGTADNITAYYNVTTYSTVGYVKWLIYNSDNSFNANTTVWTMINGFDDWLTIDIDQGGTIADANYWLCVWQNIQGTGLFYYDNGGDLNYDSEVFNVNTQPDPWASADFAARLLSIYCNYTAAGGAPTWYNFTVGGSAAGEGGTNPKVWDTAEFGKEQAFQATGTVLAWDSASKLREVFFTAGNTVLPFAAEEFGRELAFQATGTTVVWDTIIYSTQLAGAHWYNFTAVGNILPLAAEIFNKAVDFQAGNTLLVFAHETFGRELSFLATQSVTVWDSAEKTKTIIFTAYSNFNVWASESTGRELGFSPSGLVRTWITNEYSSTGTTTTTTPGGVPVEWIVPPQPWSVPFNVQISLGGLVILGLIGFVGYKIYEDRHKDDLSRSRSRWNQDQEEKRKKKSRWKKRKNAFEDLW